MKTAIVVGPHPDDIEIGAGGTVSRLVRSDWRVELLILTTESDAAVSSRRKAEAVASADALGVPEQAVHFCDLPDKQLAQVPSADAIDRIRTIVRGTGAEPDLVITNTAADSHTDHKAAHVLTVGAFRTKPILFYPVINHLIVSQFTPRVFVDITADSDRKRAALDCHASQADVGRIRHDELQRLERDQGRRIGVDRAEGFEVAVQAGAEATVRRLISELNDCPFHRFWHDLLGDETKLFVFYATPVVRKALLASRRINYDAVGIDLLNGTFSELWYGQNPMSGNAFPAADDGAGELLDAHHVLISGGATSNKLTDRYFNHFAGLRYVIDHTMPGYRDLRVHDRVAHREIRSQYGRDSMGRDTILRDVGLLTVMRNPVQPDKVVLGCMGVHSPGSLGCFRVISDRLLLKELMTLSQMPLVHYGRAADAPLGFQVLVEQELPPESRTAPRIVADSIHEIRVPSD